MPWAAVIPPDFLTIVLACIAFVGVAELLSHAIGLPIVWPSEGRSVALGTHPSVPLVGALIGYGALQTRLRLRARDGDARVQWLRNVGEDLFFLAIFAVVMFVHFHIKMWMPVINGRLHDELYFAIDGQLRFLLNDLRAARAAIATVLPAPDVWYQLAFFSMFSLTFWFHAGSGRRWHYHNMFAITLTELLGPLLYLPAPAVGPFIFERGDNALATAAQLHMYEQFQAAQAGGVGWLVRHGGEYFTAPLAAMPSLHFAASFVMAYYAVRARLLIAPIAVAAVGWIVVESVTSRWHYLVDLPAGLVVAVAVIALTNRVCRFRLEDGGS